LTPLPVLSRVLQSSPVTFQVPADLGSALPTSAFFDVLLHAAFGAAVPPTCCRAAAPAQAGVALPSTAGPPKSIGARTAVTAHVRYPPEP
jgi:hypothetical protein